MSETSRIIRKFERFLSGRNGYYNNCTEIRPDGGAILDEKEKALEARRYKKINRTYGDLIQDIGEHKITAQSVYNHKTKKDTMYGFRSRGNKETQIPL